VLFEVHKLVRTPGSVFFTETDSTYMGEGEENGALGTIKKDLLVYT